MWAASGSPVYLSGGDFVNTSGESISYLLQKENAARFKVEAAE